MTLLSFLWREWGSAFLGSTSGFALIPGVRYAFKSVGTDLADYVGPVPLPATWSLFVTGSACSPSGDGVAPEQLAQA